MYTNMELWSEVRRRVLMVHRPGEAQADFGEVSVIYRGQQRKVAMFVMSLPFSDALFVRSSPGNAPRRLRKAIAGPLSFSRPVPKRVSYDNSRIAVTKVIQKRGGEFTREFLRLESHYLFAHHFCLVRRPNEK